MRIEEILTMRGPNQWSRDHRHIIVAKVQFDQDPLRAEYVNRLFDLFPELKSYQAEFRSPGFLLGALALELQRQAKMHIHHLEVKETREKHTERVIISYDSEEAGRYSLELALDILIRITKGEKPDHEAKLEKLKDIAFDAIGPTTAFLLSEVRKKDIPYKQFEHGSLVTLGWGNKQKKMRTAVVDSTSGIGIEIAGDKEETKALLREAGVPVPDGMLVYSEADLEAAVRKTGFPIVLKPLDGNHGRGVTTNITDMDKARFGFALAQKISRAVILEKYITGHDHRFLVIDYKLVAVARRTPAKITGDGKSTIRQLIDEENKHPDRGDTSEHVLATIKVDSVTQRIFERRGVTEESVLPEGEILYLKDIANISAGGTSDDVTDEVHPENRFMAERIAKMFNLNICGIDILASDVSVPIAEVNGAVIEVNAGPGIRMHTNPTTGIPRNVAKPIVDMLFPTNDARIPVIAITGTNGKTTTTRMVAHIGQSLGYEPGYATSEGIYIKGHLIEEGDCTGAQSAQRVLFDPTIDLAVLECARGGIIRSGLGFDRCDISIITNVTDDHLGMRDIHTIEQMAEVKSVVARSTRADGYAVLNADDDLVYNMQADLQCKIALFSMDETSMRIRAHIEAGGVAGVIEDGHFTLYNGGWKSRLDRIEDVPVTLGGRAECMVKNALAAMLATAILNNFELEKVREGMRSFIPSPGLTPGRFNIFDFQGFEVMVDYANNTDGLLELKKFLDKTNASVKIGIVAATGDRRDEDIIMQGKLSAEMFDELILRDDDDLRGRTSEELQQLLHKGIGSTGKNIPVRFIASEREAIEYAIRHASAGSIIVTRADHVFETLRLVEDLQQKHIQFTKS